MKSREYFKSIKFCDMPDTIKEPVDWHHFTDEYVIALPREEHRQFGMVTREEHRARCLDVILKYYGYDIFDIIYKLMFDRRYQHSVDLTKRLIEYRNSLEYWL